MKRLVSTIGLEHAEWLQYRKKGITGSDAGAICGMNPYRSAFKVYEDKLTLEVESFDNEAMKQGRDLEDYVARRFMETTGKKVKKANAIFYNEQHPILLADFDRLIVGEKAGLECKTVNAYSADKWKEGKIPVHYLMQCQHYLAVSGFNCWYVAALILGREFIVRRIDRDEELIQNLILIEEDFWSEHILKKRIPNPDGSSDYTDTINQLYPVNTEKKEIQLFGYEERMKRRTELNELIKKLELEREQIDQQIKLEMQDASSAISGIYRVSWNAVESSRIDTAKLKREFPKEYERCLRKTNYRKFTVKVA